MATFSKQSDLPKLPVPTLNETLDRYINCARALCSKEEYEHTITLVNEFRYSPLASQLQEALLNRAKEKDNWLEDWWYDVYNEVREPLAPYLSLASCNSYYPSMEDSQISRAADIAYYWMTFWEKIRSETLPVTRSRGVVWDMHQYHCLFNSTRVPALPKDRLDRYFKTAREGECPSHIAVFCRGNVWKVDMVRVGKLIGPDELYQALSFIDKNSGEKEDSLISLTTEHRDVWAKQRESIINFSALNKNSIAMIEQAVLCLTLAEESVPGKNEGLEAAMMYKSRYVWADKSVNLIVYKDGQLKLQGDHSNVDAIVVLHAADMAAAKVRKFVWTPTCTAFVIPDKVDFNFSSDHVKAIKEADAKFNRLKANHRVNLIEYDGYGNDLLKTNKLYADTVVQIAMQLSFLRTHGSFAPIYETASTRKFYHGRTETVRGCTEEMVVFGKAMMMGRDPHVLFPLFKAAYEAHNKLMADCMEAKGFDRHILGLRNCLAEFSKGCSPKQSTPRFLTDPVWKKVGGDGNFLLSTSFIGYMLDSEMGSYGYVCAMRPDGYGTFYKIGKKRIVLVTTDWKNTKSNLPVYGENLRWAFDQIASLLKQQSKS